MVSCAEHSENIDTNMSAASAAAEYAKPGRAGFLPGNPGRPKGGTPRAKRDKLLKTANEILLDVARDDLPQVISQVVDLAKEGDLKAAGLLLRHMAPVVPNTIVRAGDGLAHLPPDQRVREIAAAVAKGEMPIEHGRELTAMARQELEVSIMGPLRAALAAIKAGEAASKVMAQLASTIDPLMLQPPPEAIEHNPTSQEATGAS